MRHRQGMSNHVADYLSRLRDPALSHVVLPRPRQHEVSYDEGFARLRNYLVAPTEEQSRLVPKNL